MYNDILFIESYIIEHQNVKNIYDKIELHNEQRYNVLFELISEIGNA